MKMDYSRRTGASLLLVALLAACASPPPPPPAEPVAPAPTAKAVAASVKVDESAMLPLLGYQQLLAQLSGPELAREQRMLSVIPQTPATQVRLAMLLGNARNAPDLARAAALLDQVLKSTAPAAVSVQPLALALSSQYHERLRLRQLAQGDKRQQQLIECQRYSGELEQKLDALAAIEGSLPQRSAAGAAGGPAPRGEP